MILKDFIFFRRMLTPLAIQILFWLGVAACIVAGLVNLFHKQWMAGLQILIFGPILARIVCEFFIVFFRMNDTLFDIKNELKTKKKN